MNNSTFTWTITISDGCLSATYTIPGRGDLSIQDIAVQCEKLINRSPKTRLGWNRLKPVRKRRLSNPQ